jgi:hypothetical protein
MAEVLKFFARKKGPQPKLEAFEFLLFPLPQPSSSSRP